MDTLKIDFMDITVGLFVFSIGLITVVVSLFRLRSKDFSLLNFELFSSLYGIRWLVETPTMKNVNRFSFHISIFPRTTHICIHNPALRLSR